MAANCSYCNGPPTVFLTEWTDFGLKPLRTRSAACLKVTGPSDEPLKNLCHVKTTHTWCLKGSIVSFKEIVTNRILNYNRRWLNFLIQTFASIQILINSLLTDLWSVLSIYLRFTSRFSYRYITFSFEPIY